LEGALEEARGGGSSWRFAEATRQQAEEGWSLRDQLTWRIGELTNSQNIDLAEHAEHFPEVLDAYTLNRITPVLVARDKDGELISKASLEDGGSIRLTGFLMDDGRFVGEFMRRLQLDRGLAIHEHLVIDPPFRGQGIGARFVHRSFDLYDALGLEQVGLKASLATGRWYWAQLGFDFVLPEEVGPIRSWTKQVCAATGIGAAALDGLSSAPQFARLDGTREISFGEMVAALPDHEERLKEIAEKNGFALDDEMGLGKAVMLSGPEWSARLRLDDGAQRRSFEEALLERSARAQERSEIRLRESEAAAAKDGSTTDVAATMEE
jgi:GNAT superfamily N-acetyltransferase